MQATVKLSAFCRNTEERKLIAPTVHFPTAQHVIRYFCPARSQTILQTPTDRSPKTTISLSRRRQKPSLKLMSYVGRPIVLKMKHLYQLI